MIEPAGRLADVEALEALIPADVPTRPRALGVLDGVLPGSVWRDDAPSPAWAVVVEAVEGGVYCGGDVSREMLLRVFAEARTLSRLLVVGFTGSSDPLRALLPASPSYTGRAIDFTERVPLPDEHDLLASPPPDDLELIEVDTGLLPRTTWHEETLYAFRSADAWNRLGEGRCLMRGDSVVAQALAGPRVRGEMELGVWTHDGFRNRGYARRISVETSAACEARGDVVWWNTNVDNAASIAVARRIGFQRERPYDLVAYPTSKT